MRRLVFGMLVVGLLSVLCTGCGGPDPTKNPNFNEKTLEDPGAVKMQDMTNMQQPGSTN